MKKVKILSISSALCLGTTLFAAVSCNKTEENKTEENVNATLTKAKDAFKVTKKDSVNLTNILASEITKETFLQYFDIKPGFGFEETKGFKYTLKTVKYNETDNTKLDVVYEISYKGTTIQWSGTLGGFNPKTILKASAIDLSNDSTYKDKFATIDGNLGITKDQINTIIQSKKGNLFFNLISNSNLSIKDQLCIPDEGIISVHVELDKHQDEKGQIVETPITFEVKLTGLKKDGLNTYIDYDDSNNKSITLSGKEQTQASEWITNVEQAKSDLFAAIKSKIKNPKPGTTISNEDIVFGVLQSNNDKGLVYVETTFKNSIWWENGFSKEFKTTINFYGFKTLDSTQPEKNTKAIPNENVLKKEGTNPIYYSYFSEEFKNIKIELNTETTVEESQTQIKKFINDKQMFIHNFEDSNIEIKNIENTNNVENIKKGFFDFQIVFKNPTSSTSKTRANKNTNIGNNTTQPPFSFNLRFSGFKVEQETPKNLEIESSEWFMKNNIIPGENQDKFYYGIKVILKGDFSGVDLEKPTSPISAILKYNETSNGTTKTKKINLFLYITEKNNENNKLTLFFAHSDWNDKNYPNGGEIFDKSQIILNVPGFDSVQGEIPGGIDQFEVKQISTNSVVFKNKKYHYFSIDLNSKLGNLPGMSADRISKDYVIKFQKDNNEVEAKACISKWVNQGKEVTLYAFFDNATDETEFNKYKEETNISIKIPGFKVKNVYFKGNTIVNS
ncbi:MAG: hypothetical protein IKG36_01025 [Mycoplasmataceae bacterium]|nr:hypothetical protein [Mycoplasmataceae bacterium]